MKALEILKLCQAVDDLDTRPIIKDIQYAVQELQILKYNYEAQEIIIRGKTAIMESMQERIKELEGAKQ